jgi:hypothetical protein
VGLASIQVWGQKIDFYEGVVNESMPLKDDPVRRQKVDSLLIEQRMYESLDDLYI